VQLAYDIGLDRPGGENVLMSISIVDRDGAPRIVEFEIKGAILRLPRKVDSGAH
jgi:hypothetical protein